MWTPLSLSHQDSTNRSGIQAFGEHLRSFQMYPVCLSIRSLLVWEVTRGERETCTCFNNAQIGEGSPVGFGPGPGMLLVWGKSLGITGILPKGFAEDIFHITLIEPCRSARLLPPHGSSLSGWHFHFGEGDKVLEKTDTATEWPRIALCHYVESAGHFKYMLNTV